MAESSNQSPKITLYWLEQSRAHRILWLLEELGLEAEIKRFKRDQNMLADPALKKVHPLGKAPIITIETPGSDKPLVLAESGPMIEYLVSHYGQHLVPKRYKDGLEHGPGAETEEWIRDRYFMHYVEGSLMSVMLVALVINNIRTAPVPFFVKPITKMIAGKVDSLLIKPNFETHFKFLNDQVKTSSGQYLCGDQLTGSDIMISYPLKEAIGRGILTKESYPELVAYADRISERPAYKRALEKDQWERNRRVSRIRSCKP